MKIPLLSTLLGVVVSAVWVLVVTAGDPGFTVRISGSSVFITCPGTNPGAGKVNLSKDGKPMKMTNPDTGEHELKKYEEDNNGEYLCEVQTQNYRLYLKAKVCERCIDMEFWTVAGIVVGDLLITVGVVILVYFWAKGRKQSPGAGGAPARRTKDTKERPPPVPNPDYEPIRKGQRDVYDGLKPVF
ncbi:T-cell surface glycoprotein CD3 epsilon chain [Lissotriton helveticus]